MKPEKKPRADSKLDSMPESRVLELRDKLLGGISYQECLSWLAAECGVASSLASLSSFYKRHCAPVVRERRLLSVVKAEALGDAMAADPVNWDEKIVDRTKQLVFEFLSSDTQDPDTAGKLLDAVVKARKQEFAERIQTRRQETEERKLALLEAKAQRADEAQGVVEDSTLSEEERTTKLRQIFRM